MTMRFQELQHRSACMQALPAVRSSLAGARSAFSRCICFSQLLPSNNLGWLAEGDMQWRSNSSPARLLTVRFCFSINTTVQHPTASGPSWRKPWRSLHRGGSSQTNSHLSQWQVRENARKCERLVPKPNRTRIASACPVCHGYPARTPRGTEPDRLKLESPDASDCGSSTCNKSPFPTKLAALQGLGLYRRPRPSTIRVHPSRRLGGLPDRTTWPPNQYPWFNFTSLSRTKLSCQVHPRARHGLGALHGELVFFRRPRPTCWKLANSQRLNLDLKYLSHTGLSDCQDTPIMNSLLLAILGAHHPVGQPSPPSPCFATPLSDVPMSVRGQGARK